MRISKQAFLLVGLLLGLGTLGLEAQTGNLVGKILDEKGQSRSGEVFLAELSQKKEVGSDGAFRFEGLAYGVYTLTCYVAGLQSQSQTIRVDRPEVLVWLSMREFSQNLRTIEVEGQAAETSALTAQRLYAVEGVGIYEAKKNEVIILNNIASNEATNNARQIFGRVPGLNIWESDAAGLQLDIAARGLSPGRTANFNTRLNGYDMSADALGYPESYYTPPMQAVERIEVVRGAASLQYGPQFGGMVNFVLKEAPQDQKFSGELDLAGGSYGFFNAFGSVSGTLGKWHYLSYYQYKHNEGWRPNSGFDLHSAFVRLGYRPSESLDFRIEYASLYYLAQQPGGLTDAFFAQDPRQSQRARNWFKVNWNLFAFLVDYRLSERTRLNFRQFWLLSGREALGNLERITVADFGDNRTLIRDQYRNFGQETRLLHRYSLGSQRPLCC
ncbi:MAG: TonB-dependent receptor plug domain-containing protein [Microscillaceae bacterium]|nr:TonB-dependent receptor plug domain-containing protein [Microscillaceae bacterium]